ncbi:MAG: SAM-dependent methyltransferase, partial [Thermoplasmata archaeon]
MHDCTDSGRRVYPRDRLAKCTIGLDVLLKRIQHPELLWNSPLSTARADRLLDNLDLSSAHRIIDLGCGWGELLLRALGRAPRLIGEGIDTNEPDLLRGRAAAQQRGLAGRATLLEGDVTRYNGNGDRAICVGASHAWGGTDASLRSLRAHVEPKGRLLFGDGFWVRPASKALVEMFGELAPSVDDLVRRAVAAGWSPVGIEIAGADEWDEFENNWGRAFEVLARKDPDQPLAAEVR